MSDVPVSLTAPAPRSGAVRLTTKFHDIAEWRGKTKANVGIARRVLTLVYYGPRDCEIRCLRDQEAA